MKLAQAVHDYITLKQSLGFRFHTEATILKAFCNALGEVAIIDVEPHWVTSYLAGSGPVTRYWHRKYEALSGFYRFALGRGYVLHSPLPTTVPKRPQPFRPYIYPVSTRRRGPRLKKRPCAHCCCCSTGPGYASARPWR
jgi:hypothetical protein